MFGKHFPLSFNIALLGISTVVVTAVSIGFVTFQSMRTTIHAGAEDNLAEVARLNAELVARPFEQMAGTARAMAATPAVEGLMLARASATGREDTDFSADARGRARLEGLFAAVLASNDTYTRMRFIGLADGAREIVRVDRTDAGFEHVPHENLRQTAVEPYMAALASATGPYFSAVTIDREEAAIDPPSISTIRLIHPVSTSQGEVFGAIVVDADYEAALTSVRAPLSAGHTLTILNDAQDHVVMEADGTRTSFHDRSDPNWQPSPVAGIFAPGATAVYRDNRIVAYQQRKEILPQEGGFGLSVVASAPSRSLMGPARDTMRRIAVVVVCLAFLTLVAGPLISRRMTRPLKRLLPMIEARRNLVEPVSLHSGKTDEILQLAEAYTDLVNELNDRTVQSMTIFRSAPDGILTVEEDGTILTANPAAHDIFGFADDDLIGQNIDRLIPMESRARHRQLMVQVSRSDSGRMMAQNRDVFGLRRNGERFALEASLNVALSGDRKVYVVILRDISLRKAQENHLKKTIAELAQKQRELERSNQELDQFAYVASHDLKAPLRVIDNASRWLEQDLDQHLDDDTRESMQLLRSRIKRMEQLLNDLLQHSRIGRERYSTKMASGREILDDVIELASLPDGFEVDVDPAFDHIELQVMPLQTVLLNLVRNAIKHHDKPRGRVRVSVEFQGEMLAFSVDDDGPGIEPQYSEKVFQMFQTLKPRDQVEGSGIGLAVVKKTVELVGGEITLVPSEGRGSSFRFTWPKHTGPRATEGQAA